MSSFCLLVFANQIFNLPVTGILDLLLLTPRLNVRSLKYFVVFLCLKQVQNHNFKKQHQTYCRNQTLRFDWKLCWEKYLRSNQSWTRKIWRKIRFTLMLYVIPILKEILEMEPCLEQDILASDKFQLGQVSQFYFCVLIGRTIIKAKWCDFMLILVCPTAHPLKC